MGISGKPRMRIRFLFTFILEVTTLHLLACCHGHVDGPTEQDVDDESLMDAEDCADCVVDDLDALTPELDDGQDGDGPVSDLLEIGDADSPSPDLSDWPDECDPSGPSPVIDAIAPLRGGIGSPLVITGSSLGADPSTAAVRFSGASLGRSFDEFDPTRIVVRVPVGAVSGPLQVETDGCASNQVAFTVLDLDERIPPAPTAAEVVSVDGHYTCANQLLVQLRAGQGIDDADAMAPEFGATVTGYISGGNLFLFEFDPAPETHADLTVTADSLMGLETVVAVSENVLLEVRETLVDSTERDDRWDLYNWDRVQLQAAHNLIESLGGGLAPVTLAIIDTGREMAHQEFTGLDTTGSLNFTTTPLDANVQDGIGHGTGVTSVAAAVNHPLTENDNLGFSGVLGVGGGNPNVRSYRIDDQIAGVNLNPYASQLLAAINRAGSLGVPVVNCSSGITARGADPAWFRRAVTNLRANVQATVHGLTGTLFVTAAGNDGVDIGGAGVIEMWNFVEPNVLDVAATDPRDARCSFSNYGGIVSIAAPGQDIVMADLGAGNYIVADGTSFAAPQVSATAALLRSIDTGLSPANLVGILTDEDNTDPQAAFSIDAGGAAWAIGRRLNIAKAVRAACLGQPVARYVPSVYKVVGIEGDSDNPPALRIVDVLSPEESVTLDLPEGQGGDIVVSPEGSYAFATTVNYFTEPVSFSVLAYNNVGGGIDSSSTPPELVDELDLTAADLDGWARLAISPQGRQLYLASTVDSGRMDLLVIDVTDDDPDRTVSMSQVDTISLDPTGYEWVGVNAVCATELTGTPRVFVVGSASDWDTGATIGYMGIVNLAAGTIAASYTADRVPYDAVAYMHGNTEVLATAETAYTVDGPMGYVVFRQGATLPEVVEIGADLAAMGIAVSPDARRLYAAFVDQTVGDAVVVVLDALDHTLTGTTLRLQSVPSDLEVLPDSSHLLLATSTSGSGPVIQVRQIDDDSLDLVGEWPLWIKRFDISR